MSAALWAALLGSALDAAVGDPVFAAHPVRLIGATAARAEAFFRQRLKAGAAGACAWIAVMAVAAGAGGIALTAGRLLFGSRGETAAGAILVWASVAARDLAVHALRVRKALRDGDIDAARKKVGMIVGRSTERLDRTGVARAATESVAESFVDGVAAPLFWAMVLGPLGAIAYRAANTMDSMFGHKDERYLRFGFVAAKADDALTWLPARLAGAVACLCAPLVGGSAVRAFRVFLRDRLKHESPNSAHGEAAFAGALGVVLGGPTAYPEGVVEKPFIGAEAAAECGERAVYRAVVLMAAASALWLLLAAAARAGIEALFRALSA